MDVKLAKKTAAIEAVNYVENGFIVGLGTGSTAYFAIQEIATRIKQKVLTISGAVSTSLQTEQIARQANIPLLNSFEKIDITIDGADEIDPNGNLIKGGGAALTREKIVAAATENLVIVVDQSKLVKKLGAFPLPLEILPFGWEATYKKVESFGCRIGVRKADHKLVITDNGNYVFDCKFLEIDEPEKLSVELNQIPGVVENGLFIGLTKTAIVGRENQNTEITRF